MIMFVLKKKRERETTELIHVGRLDKVIHFIQKAEEKKEPSVFINPLYFQCVFPDVFVGLSP